MSKAIEKDYTGKKIKAITWLSPIALELEIKNVDPTHTISSVFFLKKDDGIPVPDLGYLYNILIFKKKDGKEEAECFSAHLGDPVDYVNRMADLGWAGIIAKSEDKGAFEEMVKRTLEEIQFSDSTITEAIVSLTR